MSRSLKISISFKEKERYLYDYLMTKISAGVFIKELVLKDMQTENISSSSTGIEKGRNVDNGFDF